MSKNIFVLLFVSFIVSHAFAIEDERYEFIPVVPDMEKLKLVDTFIPVEDNIKKEKMQKADALSEVDKKRRQAYIENSQKIEEEIKQISMDEFDKALEKKQKVLKIIVKEEPKSEKPKKEINIKTNSFDKIIIEIDTNTNSMSVKGKSGDKFELLNSYKVSTGKESVKNPSGSGKISSISLNPTWYPTEDTKMSFKKKGIILPSVVPPNSKYNYMGLAKINLTHSVDGKRTFRIHGTLNEKTIGTKESAGCIRMKNSEVLSLAIMLNDFASHKSLDDIEVILK